MAASIVVVCSPKASSLLTSTSCAIDRPVVNTALVLESSLWFGTLGLFFYLYNVIGEAAAMVPYELTDYVTTSLDLMIPAMTWLIIPYILVYAVPLCYMSGVLYKYGLDLPRLRRTWVGFIVLIALGYFAFILVPVRTTNLAASWVPDVKGNVFDFLTVQFVSKGMTTYACFPSMHVANSWYQSRVFYEQNVPGKRAAFALAVSQFAATVGTRSHYLIDVPAGVVLAEFVFRVVFLRFERAESFRTAADGLSPRMLAVFAAVPFALWSLLMHLSSVTGWTGIDRMVATE